MAIATGLEETIEAALDGVGAEFGLHLLHVESGTEVARRADELYPLASVVKVPILLEALAQVDEGSLSLDERIPLRQEQKVLPSGVLVTLQPGLAPTMHDLLTLMIIISDNTATDMVLERIGLEGVNGRLRALDLADIHVTLSIAGMFLDAFGPPRDVSLLPVESQRILIERGTNWEGVTIQRTAENNTASPRGLSRLYARLLGGELLSAESTRVALHILQRQQLNDRLPRYLPGPTAVAHKTGTFLNTRNDAGIIYLPDGTHLILSLFALLQRPLLDADPVERRTYTDAVDMTMGRLGRAAYDYFTA